MGGTGDPGIQGEISYTASKNPTSASTVWGINENDAHPMFHFEEIFCVCTVWTLRPFRISIWLAMNTEMHVAEEEASTCILLFVASQMQFTKNSESGRAWELWRDEFL